MLSTSDLMMPPNAAPIITPTARSTTLPLNAKFLNSSSSDPTRLAGSNDSNLFPNDMDQPLKEEEVVRPEI